MFLIVAITFLSEKGARNDNNITTIMIRKNRLVRFSMLFVVYKTARSILQIVSLPIEFFLKIPFWCVPTFDVS